MYSNAQQRNKPPTKNIFQIAQKICQETEQRNQALDIINAYRKVQDIRVPNPGSKNTSKRSKDQKQQKKKPQSMYANKVKQTLKQLNANRKKQQQLSKQIIFKPNNEKKVPIGSAERHLIQSGLKRLIKLINKKYDQYTKEGFVKVIKLGSTSSQQNENKINLWKLRRVFSGWQYEVMLCKIQKQRIQKQQIQRQKRMNKWAESFYQFLTYRKVFRNWKKQTRRALKKRQLQLQQALIRQQEIAKMQKLNKQSLPQRKKQIQTNKQLKGKLRGFLDGLKQQIEGKNRVNTIKQKTQQEQNPPNNQQERQADPGNDNTISNQNQNRGNDRRDQNQEIQAQNQNKGPLTNEDLQKRRKQLQKKAKQRKEALQKLKKEKQQKKKQQEQQKLALQKEIQQEQKRLRQQQYKKFMKQKKQQEEWKIRQKQLQRQAVQFDRLRLMKFYGWQYWTKLKASNKQRGQQMGRILNKIILKRKLEKLVTGICQIGQQKLKQAQSRIDHLYRRKLMKKYINKLKDWKNEELELKQQLTARHQVNVIKIYFKQWLRARNSIQLENYEWQRPRVKKAESLHSLTLLHKGFQAFKINRDQQIQNRNVEQHKAKIKQKVHKIVEQKPTINYDDFL